MVHLSFHDTYIILISFSYHTLFMPIELVYKYSNHAEENWSGGSLNFPQLHISDIPLQLFP